ncbi:MAG: hypothetical protein Q9175_001597 [Cornicularia normoerica]
MSSNQPRSLPHLLRQDSSHFTNAPDLLAFLIGIGPLRQAELTSLHLEGLVGDQIFWMKEVLDSSCLENNISSVEQKERERLAIHPEFYVVAKLLDNCRNLSRLHLEMRKCEILDYVLFVRSELWRGRAVGYLVDGSCWVVRWPCTKEDEGVAWKEADDEIALPKVSKLLTNLLRIQHAIQFRGQRGYSW